MPFTPGFNRTLSVSVESDGVEEFTGGMDSIISKLGDFRVAVGLAGGALAGLATGGLVAATKAASNFEDSLVELEKVAGAETAAEMNSEIMEMAETIPLTQSELAELTADASRFGVEGTENLRTFTESVAKMATATNLGTEQAGESLAKLTTLTETPVSKVENLGAAINELSNNYATSSQEIVESMLRSSAAMNQLGLSNTEIVGLSASLNEVSESSERAGTRLRRFSQELMNPKKTEDLAAALGMTAEEFKTMRKESPEQLIMQMATAMKDGGETADALRTALSTTSRQALSGLGQNLSSVRESMDMANESFEEGTSLQEEFDAQTSTFSSQVQLLKNRLRALGIEVGNVLLPHLTDFLGSINSYLDSSDSVLNQLSAQEKMWGLVATAIGGAGLALGLLTTGPIAAAVTAVAMLGTAFATNFGGMRTATNRLVADLRTQFLPVMQQLRTLVTTALSRIREAWQMHRAQVIADVRALFAGVRTVVVTSMQYYTTLVQDTLGRIRSFWSQHGTQVTRLVRNYVALVRMIIRDALSMVFTLWQTHSNKVFGTVRRMATLLQTTFLGLASAVLQIISPLLSRLETFWSNHGQKITFIVRSLAGLVITIVTGLANTLMGILNVFFSIAAGAWDLFGDEIVAIVSFTADAIFSTLGWLLDGLVTLIKTTTAIMEGDWSQAWNLIAGFFERTLNGVIRFAKNWGSGFLNWLGGLIDGAIQVFKDFGNWLIFGSYIPEMFNKVLNFVGGIDLAGAIMGPLNGFKSTIEGAANTVVSTFQDTFSMVESIGSSIMSTANDAVDAASSALSKAKSMASDAASAASRAASAATSAASNAASAASDAASGAASHIPGLASGGIVTGPTLAMIGEGGESEAVIPLSKLEQMMGGGAPNIGKVEVHADSEEGGRAAARGFEDELRSAGFRLG